MAQTIPVALSDILAASSVIPYPPKPREGGSTYSNIHGAGRQVPTVAPLNITSSTNNVGVRGQREDREKGPKAAKTDAMEHDVYLD